MESELHFEWPDGSGPTPLVEAFSESRPLARRRRGARRMAEAAKGAEHAEPTDVHRALEEARDKVAHLEADRRAARTRIDELEASCGLLEARVTAQRRRLLVLERQLEGANVVPAGEAGARTSWLDRLFGGLSSVSAG